MNKKEKLNLVFDFIAEYLKDDVVEDSKTNETTGDMTRAHDIMKKIDEIDSFESRVKNELKEKMNNLKKEAKKNAIEEKNSESLEESFKNRTGVTLDSEGKITNVVVGPLKEHNPV
tara:strand:+ start:746 stop:1093 length:348 start_codon:yes stop_codon:yes gene_type:complete